MTNALSTGPGIIDLAAGLRPLRLAPSQAIGALEIHPVLLAGDAGVSYLLLHEALASKAIVVEETANGTVNELIARNVGDRPVLILEGESVMGAKQNRLITIDMLIAAGAYVTVQVGCVEQGRWDVTQKPFVSAEMAVEPDLRRSARAGMSGVGKPDQGTLWRMIAHKLGSSRTDSETNDYFGKMRHFRERVSGLTEALAKSPGQVGLLATRYGRLVGFDVLGHPDTWDAMRKRLSDSYALGSLDDDDDTLAAGPQRTAAEWLDTIAAARPLAATTEGLGTRFTLDHESLVGGGLWHEGRIVHLAAFEFARTPEAGGWVSE